MPLALLQRRRNSALAGSRAPTGSLQPQSFPGVFQPPQQTPGVQVPNIPAAVAPSNMTFPWCARVEDYGTGDLYVTGPADIYALAYEPARRGSPYEYLPDNPDTTAPFAGMVGNEYSGGSLVATNPTKDVTWWNVTIFAQELIFPAAGAGSFEPSKSEIENDGFQASILKARIRWTEYPGRWRELLVDIGTGVDIFVGPTVRVEIDIMVPLPESAPPLRPTIFGVDGRNLRFYSHVVASATCVQAPVGRKAASFTQSTYLTTGQLTVGVEIPNDGRKVQALSTVVAGNDVVGFNMTPPSRLAPAVPPTLVGLAAFDGPQTDIVDVPQNAKSVFASTAALATPRTVTYRFELQR